MNVESIREYCLSLPHVTEDVKWEKDLTFLIGEKMFAVVGLEPGNAVMSFKAEADEFEELVGRSGVIPAPYLARYKWVALEGFDVIRKSELHELIKKSYNLVFAKLPKRLREELTDK